jgi:hypothetical protein
LLQGIGQTTVAGVEGEDVFLVPDARVIGDVPA